MSRSMKRRMSMTLIAIVQMLFSMAVLLMGWGVVGCGGVWWGVVGCGCGSVGVGVWGLPVANLWLCDKIQGH